MTEERINGVEVRCIKLAESEQQIDNSVVKKNEQSFRDLWYNNIRSNICVIRVAEGEEYRNKKYSKKW